MEYTTLNNGIKVPLVGFGVYQIPQSKTVKAVTTALDNGYRMIDTADYYHNEKEVGEAVAKSDVPRDQVFITSKIQPAPDYDTAMKEIDESVSRIGDYVDLMLIHWPGPANVENYRALEDAQKAGKLRSIGLSSFYGKEYQEILDKCDVKPVIDQNETHIFRQQRDFHEQLENDGVKLEAWSPLVEGIHDVFETPTLKKIAEKHHTTTPQVMLRCLVQRGIIVLPRSENPSHIADDINLFGFELDIDDMMEIRKLDQEQSYFNNFF